MKKFILDFFQNFKNKGAKHKILVITLAVLYIFIICVCTIQVECDYTSPGDVTRVSNVIKIENEEEKLDTSRIFTVSVYTKTKMPLAQYFIAKCLDKNVEVEITDHELSDITVNEYNKMDAYAKKQSIQDSIIVAYNYAKNEGKDINLVYSYGGVVVCMIPSNFYGTGPESLMIGDLVKSIGDVEITSMEVFRTIIEDYYAQYEANGNSFKGITIPEIKVIREEKEVILKSCNASVVVNLGSYSKWCKEKNINHNYYFYDYYNIDYVNSKPQIKLQDYYAVGPSGGLMQAIYVYNVITGGDLVGENYLVGTGTITNEGQVGAVGGVKQKLITADIYLADYFFINSFNYEEALKTYEGLKNPSFKLVKVEKFEDAIKALQEGKGE